IQGGDWFRNRWTTRFDPVHAVFSFEWFDAKTRAPRPFAARAGVFMVPEGEERCRFHTFVFVKVDGSRSLLTPLFGLITKLLAQFEVYLDSRFVRHLPDLRTLKGQRLGKYDKPLIHNRE